MWGYEVSEELWVDVYNTQRYKRDTPQHELEADQETLEEDIMFLNDRLSCSLDPSEFDAAMLMDCVIGTAPPSLLANQQG